MSETIMQFLLTAIGGLVGLLWIRHLPHHGPKYMPEVQLFEQDGKKYLEIISKHSFARLVDDGVYMSYVPIDQKIIEVDSKMEAKHITVDAHGNNFYISFKQPFDISIPYAERLVCDQVDNSYILLDLGLYEETAMLQQKQAAY